MATYDSVYVGSGSSGKTIEEYQWVWMMWKVDNSWQELSSSHSGARRFADRAVIIAVVAAAVFCDDYFYGRLNSILLEDSFPKGVKLLCINFL